jgi:hypothetical protein
MKTKLLRLAGVTFVDANGRRRRRFTVRSRGKCYNGEFFYALYDHKENYFVLRPTARELTELWRLRAQFHGDAYMEPSDFWFAAPTRAEVWAYIRTPMPAKDERKWKLREVEEKLDRGAA